MATVDRRATYAHLHGLDKRASMKEMLKTRCFKRMKASRAELLQQCRMNRSQLLAAMISSEWRACQSFGSGLSPSAPSRPRKLEFSEGPEGALDGADYEELMAMLEQELLEEKREEEEVALRELEENDEWETLRTCADVESYYSNPPLSGEEQMIE
mmetsp:Transcript_325/g.579  ORF Transcript_325/g.579 Transcript_325/m.579 type:complete len:156 (+) Transcript_325:147-614(+)